MEGGAASSPSVSPERVAEHYDELDPFYRELWGEHLHHGLWLDGSETPEAAVVGLVERVAEAGGIGPGNRVCDVGSGYGATARLLARKFGARVTGYTLSERQWAVARSAVQRGAGPRPRYVLGDWLENDLPREEFDVILALESTEHMQTKSRFFTEAWRLLRPGGRLIICAWILPSTLSPWQRRLLIEPLCEEGSIAGLATSDDYRRWARVAGFDEVLTRDLTPDVRRTWSIVLRRMLESLITRPSVWAYLLDSHNRHRGFARAVLRIWTAYRVGALRYALLTGRKPRLRAGADRTARTSVG
jgi:tocopherol O-methyltransferase